jgi:hypothetical protein
MGTKWWWGGRGLLCCVLVALSSSCCHRPVLSSYVSARWGEEGGTGVLTVLFRNKQQRPTTNFGRCWSLGCHVAAGDVAPGFCSQIVSGGVRNRPKREPLMHLRVRRRCGGGRGEG